MTSHETRFLTTEVKAGLALGQSVHHILDWLEQLCGKHTFRKLFGLILADRKSEFDDVAGIEKDGRCSMYYTDPQRPDQKRRLREKPRGAAQGHPQGHVHRQPGADP